MTASTPAIRHAGATSMRTMRAYGMRRAQRARPTGSPSADRSRRERERALHLGDAVGPRRAVAEDRPIGDDAVVDDASCRSRSCRSSAGPIADGGLRPRRGCGRSRCSGRCCPTAPRGSRASVGLRRCARAGRARRRSGPGVQNPHCTAPASTKACCTSVERAVGGEALDGDDLAARRPMPRARGTSTRARRRRAPARAALALLARALRAGQAEPLAQHVEQALAEPGVGDVVIACR